MSPCIELLFHFLPTQGYQRKNPGGPLIMITGYIFPGGKFAWLTFSGVGDWKFVSGIIFSLRDQMI